MNNSPAVVARVAERLTVIPGRRLSDNRILIVDYDSGSSQLAIDALSLLFDDVVLVRNSCEAQQAMQEQEYDLVMLKISGKHSEDLLLLARVLLKNDIYGGPVLSFPNGETTDVGLANEAAKQFGVERVLQAPIAPLTLAREVVDVLKARTQN